MYRDSATALDERDRAVGAILIGEALVGACDLAAARARASDGTPVHERWRAVADVHDAYPEIWRHLDRARRVLAARGENTAKYDELRPRARRSATEHDDAAEPAIDGAALDDAKRALAELKLAVPGADWIAIDRRTDGLVRAPLSRRRRHRIAIVTVLSAFALLLVTWFVAMMPDHKPNRGEVLRRELHDIAIQRKVRIELLAVELGARCDAPRAQELTRLLAQDGRGVTAQGFAAEYTSRCGGDPIVDKWARAPIQHHRR
jgi:hypothetical protein